MDVKIHESWKNVLKEEFDKPYFRDLVDFLHKEKSEGKVIYPPGPKIFRAFDLTPFDQVRVVILGQDPYHGPRQAEGLSFSVPHGIKLPPSLQNIYKEIESDTGISTAGRDGSLIHWAEQGVFLLNAVLTVRASEPTSHSKIGWTNFTDAVIKALSDHKEGVIFLLWGNYARSKRDLIDHSRHHVLEAAHPSPLARGAFFGCRHFSQANNILINKKQNPIKW
ncbi:MAG: uracil-DNA glycosylase [Bacteroidales bacterium]|nr:uracil-DNA glycosylase [Bacteroidales bacterium]MBO7320682.1 uracil-DNA glycosylase [Bacteroidales bacterium]MBO7763769.1 uracil-DNA glycosylase [Bacteroidales bacterium]